MKDCVINETNISSHYCNCRSTAKCTCKDRRPILEEESQKMDVKSENQTTVEVDKAPMLRNSEATEVHNVSPCIAYGRFADATLRETNIDDDDDDDDNDYI